MNRVLVRFALVSAGIMSAGIMTAATQAGTVVQFNFNYSVSGSNGPINYFDVELYDSAAPITVANFLQYVNNHAYDNTIIHRDALDFVMQGGGFTPRVEGGSITALDPITSYGPIQNEFSPTRSNVTGTIAMAKVGSDPNSATSQWFVNLGNNSANLDNQNGGFTVFGKVIGEGMTLINAVNSLPQYDLSQYFGSAFTEVPLFNNGTTFVTVTSAAVVSQPPASLSGSLSGFVYVDTNHNGVMDGHDYAIGDAQLALMQVGSNTPLASIYSSSDGSFHFNNLAAGTYSIKMQTPCDTPSQAGSKWQVVLDEDGKIVSLGTAGTLLQNTYGGIPLGTGQTGLNFNFPEAVYPVALMSARMLLNTGTGIPQANAVPVLGTNAANGSMLSFGNVLVGAPRNTTLTVTNLGAEGSVLVGTFPGASGEFGPVGTSAFAAISPGQGASRAYTYTPSVRGSNTRDITITSSGGDLMVTLSGRGVAPIRVVDTSAANAGLVRIGTTGTASVTVHNVGDGNLSGAGAASNLNGTLASGSGKFSGSGGSISLSDNAAETFSFTYAPMMRTTDSTTILMQFSNGSADGANLAGTVNAELSGQGVGPVFSSDLAPGSTLDFGTVPQANLKSLFLNLSNTSTDPNGGNTALTDLTLLNAEITGTDSGLFSIVGFSAGAVLHEGGLLSLEIVYNGTGSHGDRSAMLTIVTDEGVGIGVSGDAFTYQISASLAPEPGSLVLLAIAGLLLGSLKWRRWASRERGLAPSP